MNTNQNYFVHPFDKTKKIYVFADAQHVFKNLTQAFVRNGDIIIPEELKVKFNLPTNLAKISHLKEIFDIDDNQILKLTPKVKEYMFQPTNFQKMRVKNSYHILHPNVSSALRFLATHDKSKTNYNTTAWLIEMISYWHRILTSRSSKIALGFLNMEKFLQTENFLKDMMELFTNLKFGNENTGKSKKIPSQRGAIISTMSYLNLSKSLLTNQNFKFVLGGRFSTDIVENNFSVVRLSAAKPDALQFRNITR